MGAVEKTSPAASGTTATLSIGDTKVQLPVHHGSEGPSVIDVSKLYADTGYFTLDPGFLSTASCESKITYIDGNEGILRYRGYDIDKLAEECDFLEVSYLLLNGELPDKKEKQAFDHRITMHTMVHEQLHFLFRGFPRSSHPMAIMVGASASMSAFYHDSLDLNDPAQREIAAYRMVAKMPTLAAMAYKYSIGHPFNYPQNNLGFTENFLHMMFSTPCEHYEVNPVLASAMDKILILHADHEQNASTSTVRMAASSGANPFACIGAGIASLWGPAHGGANEAVINMLEEIGNAKNIPEFIRKVKDKESGIRLMGFGHRVYKNFDPRAKIIKQCADDLLNKLGIHDPLLDLAKKLEEAALKDDYFVSRKLYPNVDFYSGIIYRAIGIPLNMFPVMFAIGRMPGWIAHWREMTQDPITKIGRPRQIYTGELTRDYVPMDRRS